MTTETESTTTLLEEVCRVLGEGWTSERDERGWRLQGPEYSLCVVTWGVWDKKGQIHIVFSMPPELSKHARYESWPAINVSETRGAIAIAGDVKRRLLPAASDIYAKLVAEQARAIEYECEQWLILDTVADALGVEHLDRARGFAQSVHRSIHKDGGRCTSAWLTADCGDVEIKVSGVPVATAVAICGLLTG